MDQQVRVRFAPSPTGQVHVGNARTASFNWLFARQRGGAYVLRIEDTDVERSETRYETQLLDDLKWLGLDWDEGPDVGGSHAPYRQSERLPIYHQHAERLLAEDKAYLCFCPSEELEQERERALAEHRKPPRWCTCRHADPEELRRRRAAGESAAIRLKIPEHPIRFHDLVRGWVEFSHEDVPDLIIVRSSGMPVYNYVVVIDDALMQITHVIRGDDHLSNTPKQVALYEAFGWRVPEFAHLSTILGEDRTRLSKRHGATSIANFREQGVLPEALVNYLALLGWAPSGGDREIFSLREMVEAFELERVTPSPAVFDMQKLYWLNRHYLSQATPERVAHLALAYFDRYFREELQRGQPEAALPQPPAPPGYGFSEQARAWLARLTAVFVPYVDRLDELPSRAGIVLGYDARAAWSDPRNREILAEPEADRVIEAFARRLTGEGAAGPGELTAEEFKAIVNQVKGETGVKGKRLFHPVRVAVTGTDAGPELDKLVPLIEEGSHLRLPRHVLSVRERMVEFMAARAASESAR